MYIKMRNQSKQPYDMDIWRIGFDGVYMQHGYKPDVWVDMGWGMFILAIWMRFKFPFQNVIVHLCLNRVHFRGS